MKSDHRQKHIAAMIPPERFTFFKWLKMKGRPGKKYWTYDEQNGVLTVFVTKADRDLPRGQKSLCYDISRDQLDTDIRGWRSLIAIIIREVRHSVRILNDRKIHLIQHPSPGSKMFFYNLLGKALIAIEPAGVGSFTFRINTALVSLKEAKHLVEPYRPIGTTFRYIPDYNIIDHD